MLLTLEDLLFDQSKEKKKLCVQLVIWFVSLRVLRKKVKENVDHLVR